jgi:holo-[acyl-carrier protein] synthase
VILGIGIDIVEVSRISSACERFGDRFLKRILTPNELTYCLSQKHSAPHIAARFAGKEAISKAFGTGIGSQLGWQDIEILRRDSGEPYVLLQGAGARLMAIRGAAQLHISLSHTSVHATAVAILERSAC